MKGLKIVSKFSDRVERSRFTLFPDLPKHIQELIILQAAKIQTPRLFRWLIVLRSVNGLFNDTIDLKGGWGRYIARKAFNLNIYNGKSLYSKGQQVQLRLVELALENDAFFQYLIPYVSKGFSQRNTTLSFDIMFSLFEKVVKFHTPGSNGLNLWYTRMLDTFPMRFFYEFTDVEIEKTIRIDGTLTTSTVRYLLCRGYRLTFTPRISEPLSIRKYQWKKILTIGHKSTIQFLLKHIYETNEDHYQQLIRWADSFKEPKKKKRKTK